MKINGSPVVNATKGITIHVTKRDCDVGQTKDPGACAAARAIIRELHADAARVHVGRVYVKTGKEWLRFNTGSALRSEIIAFDRGGKFVPGDFRLSPLQPSHRPQGKRLGGPTKPRAKEHPKIARIRIIADVRSHGANR